MSREYKDKMSDKLHMSREYEDKTSDKLYMSREYKDKTSDKLYKVEGIRTRRLINYTRSWV